MLFAVVPSRNALPDSPPIGWWIDVTVVLSVIDVLGIPMAIYVCRWWRDLRPNADPTVRRICSRRNTVPCTDDGKLRQFSVTAGPALQSCTSAAKFGFVGTEPPKF
jgi:hypothetical protein